ncbi:hypothetical protein MJO29_012273 [Puccinia striiformis f. sp. tritici]|nr:hypothetical protein Pst134EB_023816 [Puccinia striiformis f. sp. tritici]KAI7945885.1 hypothetical protein MJO29_012273 [Puccinia striiformis f. sp. tritici]
MVNRKTNQQQQQEPKDMEQQQQQQQSTKRRRYRIPRSCDRCRTSKIKCVYEDGQCTACVNIGVICTFANPGSLRERPPTRKDVEHLQARIRSLERLIHAVDPTCDLSNLPEPPQPQPSNLRLGRNRPSTSSLTLPENIHPVRNYTHTNTSNQTSPLQENSSGNALKTLFNPTHFQLSDSATNLLPSLSKLEDLSPVDKIIRHEHQKLTYGNSAFYPPPDLQQSLLEIYFQYVHPLLRIIHPASFIQDFKAGRGETDDGFKALCLIIFSVASRFSQDPRVYLDLEGNPHPSLQTAGLRYCISAGCYLLRPIPSPATFYELQAFALMVVYSMGAVSPGLLWCILGVALQRAQIAGAHQEDNVRWASSPIENHYRRKVFFLLYEFDYVISSNLGKPAYMQESDFDVLPGDAELDREFEVCANPFLKTNGSEKSTPDWVVDEMFQAYNMMKSSLGGLKNLLPVINVLHAQRDDHSGAKLSGCIKSLIQQLDSSMTNCFEKIVVKINLHHPTPNLMSDAALLSSVAITSWYHEFRVLLNQVLFNSKEKSSRMHESIIKEEGGGGGGIPGPSSSTKTILRKSRNPYLDICVQSSRAIISLINQLHQRELLAYGFFWIPLRVKNALVILICSLVKQRKSLSEDDRKSRCLEISLGIQILNALAPSTFLAGKCSEMAIQLYESAIQYNQQHANNNKSKRSSTSASFSPTASSSPSTSLSGPATTKLSQSTSFTTKDRSFSLPDHLPPYHDPQTNNNQKPSISPFNLSTSLSSSTSSSSVPSFSRTNQQDLQQQPNPNFEDMIDRNWWTNQFLTTPISTSTPMTTTSQINTSFPNFNPDNFPVTGTPTNAPSDPSLFNLDDPNFDILNFWPMTTATSNSKASDHISAPTSSSA